MHPLRQKVQTRNLEPKLRLLILVLALILVLVLVVLVVANVSMLNILTMYRGTCAQRSSREFTAAALLLSVRRLEKQQGVHRR